ncbi:MAG TPA: alanyl-tRNA editing protein [Alphaproteobacteria bacterium]|nr:alanyl-tRNA editing protein [Alphaproteobacteria bacterium]
MTKKIFWEDAYRTSLEATVASVEGADIILDATIFFALSGGQESDHGTIAGMPVRAARKEERNIVYTLAEGHGLTPGDWVTVTIDWQRRYRLMRLHFAAEIILELVHRTLGSIEKIGAHIAADKARIDFAWDESIAPQLPLLAAKAAAIVAADQEIISAFSDEAGERRYWEVAGFARVPCGGTHLKRTGEIGAITLKRKNIGKGKERIEIYVDARI